MHGYTYHVAQNLTNGAHTNMPIGMCHMKITVIYVGHVITWGYTHRDQPIMLIFSPIMPCSGAQIFHLLCSILCSCERLEPKI